MRRCRRDTGITGTPEISGIRDSKGAPMPLGPSHLANPAQNNPNPIAAAATRLEELRVWAERLPAARRRDIEPALDRLRGLLNRARAQQEGARFVGEDQARISEARANARQAVAELLNALAQLEKRIAIAA